MAHPACGLARGLTHNFFLKHGGGVEAAAERQLQAKSHEVAGGASDDTAMESASCVVCVF